jgi:hypothetical protein
MSTSTEKFNAAAQASIDLLDLDEAKDRVAAILHPQAGPTLTPAPQTQPQAPATPNRKPRSDKGIPKRPPADPDEIILRLSLADARLAALAAGAASHHDLAKAIQDQIIGHLQRRLDQLQKGK